MATGNQKHDDILFVGYLKEYNQIVSIGTVAGLVLLGSSTPLWLASISPLQLHHLVPHLPNIEGITDYLGGILSLGLVSSLGTYLDPDTLSAGLLKPYQILCLNRKEMLATALK